MGGILLAVNEFTDSGLLRNMSFGYSRFATLKEIGGVYIYIYISSFITVGLTFPYKVFDHVLTLFLGSLKSEKNQLTRGKEDERHFAFIILLGTKSFTIYLNIIQHSFLNVFLPFFWF